MREKAPVPAPPEDTISTKDDDFCELCWGTCVPERQIMYNSTFWQIARFIGGMLVGWTIAGYLYH